MSCLGVFGICDFIQQMRDGKCVAASCVCWEEVGLHLQQDGSLR